MFFNFFSSIMVQLILAIVIGDRVVGRAHISRKMATKDSRCHMLKKTGCSVSLYKISDFKEAGWFYHAPFRSCRPFYAAATNDKSHLCALNRDLPLTKEECQELCGEYCQLPDGTVGVCMLEGSCDIEAPTSWNPRPCQAHNVQCCPTANSTSYRNA